MSPSSVSVVWEYNAYLDQPRATVWVVKGDYDPEGPEPAELEAARRLIGPVECQVAVDVQRTLGEVLRWLGHEVLVHDIADD